MSIHAPQAEELTEIPTVTARPPLAPVRLVGKETMAYIGRLPAPTTDRWDWQVEAQCRGMSSAFFFHPWGERGPARDARVERAKEVCAQCPVILQCRSFALTVQEQYGVWGGLSEDELRLLLHKTRHGRGPSARSARNHESMYVTGNPAIAATR